MRNISPFQARAILLSVLLVLLLAACGGEGSQPTSAVAPTTDAIPAPTGTTPLDSTGPTSTTASTGASGALDLSSLDVCTFIPKDVLVGIFGPLKDEGTQDTVLGEEKGCTFYNEEGHFADIRIYPPDNLELRKNLEDNKMEISGLGDEAFAVDKSDAYDLFVLVRDVAFVEVRVSTHSEEQARQIAEAVLAQLP